MNQASAIFLFQLTCEKFRFTEGVAMLSSVLRRARSVQVNIAIMRRFVHRRAWLATHEDRRRNIAQREKRYDAKLSAVFATLKQVLEAPVPRKRVRLSRPALPIKIRPLALHNTP